MQLALKVPHRHEGLRTEAGCAHAPDGDIFESTMDILFNLANLLSPGEFVVVDDW
jgi:hypothetical protein